MVTRDAWEWGPHNRHAGAAANKKARRWRHRRPAVGALAEELGMVSDWYADQDVRDLAEILEREHVQIDRRLLTAARPAIGARTPTLPSVRDLLRRIDRRLGEGQL